jgi:hypothetical protein
MQRTTLIAAACGVTSPPATLIMCIVLHSNLTARSHLLRHMHHRACAFGAALIAEARKRTGLPCKFRVLFYDGRYFPSFGSIFPTSDIITVIPREMVRCQRRLQWS